MRRRRIIPVVKRSEGLSGGSPLASTFVDDFTGQAIPLKVKPKPPEPVVIVEPEPKAAVAQRVLRDAGLVPSEPKLVAPHRAGMRVTHVMQTTDGPVAIYAPVKPLRRV